MENFKKAVKLLSNKYFITALAFIVWMLFFDSNSYISHLRLNKELKKLHEEREFFINEIEMDKEETHKLMSDMDNLERYAREKYLMKRDNEDIYLIIDESKVN